MGRTGWDATAGDGAAGADRGVAIQNKARRKRLCSCKGISRCGSLPEKYSAGRKRPAMRAQFVSLVIIDATGSEWPGED